MRLITYALKGASWRSFVGIEYPKTGMVLDVAEALGITTKFTMRDFITLGEPARLAAAKAASEGKALIPMSAVERQAPIFDPEKVLCIGMNYVDHCVEQDYPVPTEPVVFNKFPSAIISSGDDIVVEGETQTKELDFEVELVIVIGKTGKAITEEKAMEHVLGYTVAHDVSARDWQLKRNGGQWLMGKCMDNFAPLGPAIVTTDEVGDPHNLGLRCLLNGKEVQTGTTEQLVFKTEALVAWCSRFMTLKAGDLILTGTPPGVGCFRKPQLFLKHGDVVTCEIDNIGSITNTVKFIAPLGPAPGPTASKL